MIGKVKTGKSFGKLMAYLTKKGQQHKILHFTGSASTPTEIAESFKAIARLRPSTTKPVKHIICAFAPQDGIIDDAVKILLAREIVERLGYTNNQWCLVSHGRDASHHDWEHNHDHIHIAINMITYNGERVKDSFDALNLIKVLAQLEQEYNLAHVSLVREHKYRRPKQKQFQNFQQQLNQFVHQIELNQEATLPQEPEIQTLEAIIQAAIEDEPTLTTYLARLQQYGYKVERYRTKGGKKRKARERLRYYLQKTDKAISRVNGGSLSQLIKAGVRYDPVRDDLALEQSRNGEKIEIDRALRLKRLKKKS